MARTRVWHKGVLEQEDFPVADVSEQLARDDRVVWVDLCLPDRDELAQLADELGLDPLAVEDAVEHHERPKVDRYPTHVFVTTYALDLPMDGPLRQSKVSAFLLPRALVTVHREDFDPEVVVRAWDDTPELREYGSRALLYGLLDVVVDGHLDVLERLDDRVGAAEDQLFDEQVRSAPDPQRATYDLRRTLTAMRKVVLPMRDVADSLARHGDPADQGELGERFRDLRDHVIRANEWTENLRDVVTTIVETGLSLANAQLNQVVRKLSAWAAIIAVPTAVTGFYGQNVPYPGFGQDYGFVTSSVITVLLAGGAWLGFRRKGWL
ncbi:MAG: Magnesium and cobalt transport protein CorA [uncultured Corynebacteriales bacterium]|uniref:Magnesium and cobalt transport protein CorA n=1 Tax=uncultured Mycobacteriales bacterium TaxID=581187 RepID=A0A6J4K144_9ACTN|nr:MAG: Magnesium and cobalt transport protein CorA [uncultured Corynebacteriales bacterium]